MQLFTKAHIEKRDDDYIAVASSEIEDRQGEVVKVDGWDLKNFKKNPVLLLFHDHHSLPVGKAEKIWIDKEDKKLMFKPVFETVTERGRAIAELVKQGFLNTFSVGFRPIDSDGNTFTKQELHEISLVNVPANPDAMMRAYKSLEEEGFKKETIDELMKQEMPKGMPGKMSKAMSSMKTAIGHMDDMMDMMGSKGYEPEESDIEQRLKAVEDNVQIAVKGLKHLNPHIGRDKLIVKERLSMNKVIAKANDMMMQNQTPDTKKLQKVIKRANEILIVSQKGDINGKN